MAFSESQPDDDAFNHIAEQAVQLANRIAEADKDADVWDIASGLLAGAVQFWLYSRQPCGDPQCESCQEISTAQQRLTELLRETRELAEDSEYFHSPNDSNVGRA